MADKKVYKIMTTRGRIGTVTDYDPKNHYGKVTLDSVGEMGTDYGSLEPNHWVEDENGNRIGPLEVREPNAVSKAVFDGDLSGFIK